MIRVSFSICWASMNLGTNPENGGSPPRERSLLDRIKLRVNLFCMIIWFKVKTCRVFIFIVIVARIRE